MLFFLLSCSSPACATNVSRWNFHDSMINSAHWKLFNCDRALLTCLIVVFLYIIIAACCGGITLPSCRSWLIRFFMLKFLLRYATKTFQMTYVSLYLKGFQSLMVQIFCGVYGSKLSVVFNAFFLKLRMEGWDSSDKPVQFFQCRIIISSMYSLNTWILTKRHHLLWMKS